MKYSQYWWFDSKCKWAEVPWPEDYGVEKSYWGIDFSDHLAMREQAWAISVGYAERPK